MAEREEPTVPPDDAGADVVLPDEFGRIEELLRTLSVEDFEPVEPPDHVWAGIRAGLAAEESRAGVGPAVEGSAGGAGLAAPVSLEERRSRRRRSVLLASAAALVLVGGGAMLLGQQTSEPAIVASAELAYDPEAFDPLGSQSSARVSLVDDDGRLRIAFDDAQLPASLPEDADLELWLIEPDSDGQVSDLRSLGLVQVGELASLPIPDDLDPETFRVVDISIEPRDGDPTHSGRSILRGALEAS